MDKGKYFGLAFVLFLILIFLCAPFLFAQHGEITAEPVGIELIMAPNPAAQEVESNIMGNVFTDFNKDVESPTIDPTAYVHSLASVIGDATIGKRVMISPGASIRSDEGQPIHIGDESNAQDGVIVHALETEELAGGHWEEVEGRTYEINGSKYAVYIGERVSLAHQAQVHGPAVIGDDTFVGMQVLVFCAKVGNHCVLEPTAKVVGAKVSGGIVIEDGRYVPAGMVVTTQEEADNLPLIANESHYAYEHTNHAVVHVNCALADGYNREKISIQQAAEEEKSALEARLAALEAKIDDLSKESTAESTALPSPSVWSVSPSPFIFPWISARPAFW
ncbi:MAG: carbonic anhydrase [bacterium]